jgi:hypothetical protein
VRAFEARYPGRCNECDEWFSEGTMIRYNSSDEIVHEDCGGWDDPVPDACPECHTVHKGECW